MTTNLNYGHFIEKTIKSVVDQRYPNLEYFVIDGGSTDDSWSIIDKYKSDISAAWIQRGKGFYQAIEEGLSIASGSIQGWINSDDMHLPWTLWVVGSIFASLPEVEWISTLHCGGWDYVGKIRALLP